MDEALWAASQLPAASRFCSRPTSGLIARRRSFGYAGTASAISSDTHAAGGIKAVLRGSATLIALGEAPCGFPSHVIRDSGRHVFAGSTGSVRTGLRRLTLTPRTGHHGPARTYERRHQGGRKHELSHYRAPSGAYAPSCTDRFSVGPEAKVFSFLATMTLVICENDGRQSTCVPKVP